MEIQKIENPDQIGDIIPVIESAWGMDSMDSLVKDVVSAMRYHGGLVLGAYEGNEMIGMQYSFPGYKNGRVYLYSHMTGVKNDKKYSGIGFQLKTRQKEWAVNNGFELIAWTFDPLMSLNANFNIHKLGAISRTYLPDFYGRMDDSLNNGLATDRFVAEWWIKRDKTVNHRDLEFINEIENSNGIEKCGTVFDPKSDDIAFRVPRDFLKTKREDKEAAKDWRGKSRVTFAKLFSQGYVVMDFNKENGNNFYILQKKPEFLSDERSSIFW